ncbi:MAG: hypothetical protein IPJ19_17450 [Planctomycetes bacterium]|nr:hypothetical protein [Planctomycetota bacterium]
MNPESTLRRLCERNQVPYSYGERLLPIVRRALEAPDATRDRILALVERNLQQRADGAADSEKLARDLESEILLAVARVLHDWSPSDPLLDIGKGFKGFPFGNTGLGT